jgi:hypothetical protein
LRGAGGAAGRSGAAIGIGGDSGSDSGGAVGGDAGRRGPGAEAAGPSPFGERGAELAAGIRSFADLSTEEVQAWARADGRTVWERGVPDRPEHGLAPAASPSPDPEVPGPRREPCPDPGPLVVVDAGSAEFAAVWPARNGGLEPRPGLLTSVVRAGTVLIYPPPLFDPRVAVATRTGVWPIGDERPSAGPSAPPTPETPPLPDPGRPVEAASQKAYVEIRQLVGVLVEVMAGRRSPQQVALWVHARVREALRDPATSRYSGTAVLRRVRLSTVGSGPDTGVEVLALVQDGTRMRAAAFRFDAVPDPGRGTTGTARWQCTALQTA